MKKTAKKQTVNFFKKLREVFRTAKPLEDKEFPILRKKRRFAFRSTVAGLTFLMLTPFISKGVQNVVEFFNPDYKPKIVNVVYAAEKKPIVLSKEIVNQAFTLGEKSEVKNITLKGYIKEYLRYELQRNLYDYILRGRIEMSTEEEFVAFSPFLGSYAKDSKELKFLVKKGKIYPDRKEGFSWFFESYLLYLELNGKEGEMKSLFEEYKNFVETELSKKGIFLTVEPEKQYRKEGLVINYYKVMFNLADESISKEEKMRIADEIAKLTTDFMYNKITTDPKCAYLKDMFEDYLKKGSKGEEGFRVYKYTAKAPWGDEYTLVATIESTDFETVKLGLVALKGNKLIAWDFQRYLLKTITKDEEVDCFLYSVGPNFTFPIKVGFLTQYAVREGKELFVFGVILSHEDHKNRGLIRTIGIYRDLDVGKGRLDYISAL